VETNIEVLGVALALGRGGEGAGHMADKFREVAANARRLTLHAHVLRRTVVPAGMRAARAIATGKQRENWYKEH
jgi:hypothetical protein